MSSSGVDQIWEEGVCGGVQRGSGRGGGIKRGEGRGRRTFLGPRGMGERGGGNDEWWWYDQFKFFFVGGKVLFLQKQVQGLDAYYWSRTS